MELIKKTIYLSDYICRVNPYIINGLIPEDIDYTGITSHWGELIGIKDNGEVEYYVGKNTTYTSNLCSFNILFIQSADDIGVLEPKIENWVPNKLYFAGESKLYNGHSYRCTKNQSKLSIFDLSDWELNTIEPADNNIITFTGESKINEFRRYSKSNSDRDLYNPTWNSGFTQEIKSSYGNINKIISESSDFSGENQGLYEYIIGATENELETTGIHYKDVSSGISNISYLTNGLTAENSISSPNIKSDYLLGIIETPKTFINVKIDRGVNSTFEKNLKLGDIRTLDDLTKYGNGFFKIKDN